MPKRSFAEWQSELSTCATSSLCDIEAGYHGPCAELLLEQWSGHRRNMMDAIAGMMLADGYPVVDVIDALRAALGFKQ